MRTFACITLFHSFALTLTHPALGMMHANLRVSCHLVLVRPLTLAVKEIPFVDKSSERELLLLLGDWYEPESIESLFSFMPSDAVFFSS